MPNLPTLRRPCAAIGASLLAVALTGCVSTRGLEPSTTLRDANAYETSRSLAGAPLSDAAFPQQDWWVSLGDTQLNKLMDEALRDNPSLTAADARLRKAQAQAGLADAATKATLGGSAQYALAQLPTGLVGDTMGGKLMHNPMLMLNFDWPLDVWGGKRAEYEAALGQAHAAQIDAQAARLTLAANIARSYVALAQAFDALDVAQREQARSERLQTLNRQRVEAGLDNALSLRNAEAAIATAKAQAQAAQQQIDALRNTLAAMLGQGPDRGLDIARPKLLNTSAPVLPSVLPSELLGHRPDVVAARWRVEAAGKSIKSAKAKFRPSVDLSAMLGLVANNVSGLFNSNAALGFGGPAISLPIFDGGQLRNNLAAKNADYDLAVASYNQTVVDALHQVADAVQSLRSLDAQQQSLTQAHTAADSALQLASHRYQAGLGTQLDVLNAQRPLLQLEQQLAALRAQRYATVIDLNRALGGGLNLDAPAADSAESTPENPAKTPAP